MAKLIITEGGRDKIYEIADVEFTIGGGGEADLQLRDDAASPLHLTVKQTKAGFRLVDMETKTGTVVNGSMVNQHTLTNGDTIQIGDAKITYIGKGPSRAAAGSAARRARPGVQLGEGASRRIYRHERWDEKLSTGGRLGLAALVVGAVLLLGVMMLKGSEPPENKYRLAAKEAREALKRGSPEDEIAVLVKHAKQQIADSSDRKDFRKLERELEARKQFRDDTDNTEQSAKDLIRLKNMRRLQPNNIDGFRKAANAWLDKYDELNTTDESWVREELGALNNDVPPQQRRFGELEAKVNELCGPAAEYITWECVCPCKSKSGGHPRKVRRRNKRYREAYELIQNADAELKALYAEELAAMALTIRKKSRASVTVRKNEARHELRLWHNTEARRQVEDMYDKLVLETLEAYIEYPDGWKGGYSPETQRWETAVGVLLKEFMAKTKAKMRR